jgi:hypothetical protein
LLKEAIIAEEKKNDYIPAADLTFLEWAKNFQEVADAMATAW